MKLLVFSETKQVNAAGAGAPLFFLTTGLVTGGVPGLGIAACALVGEEGVNKLHDLIKEDQ